MNRAGIEIGETLRAARKRSGLQIAELEHRTHIRGRYLRALEDENWTELPSDTYARAFLRTYAEELGLDAEALGDELRLRQGGRVGGAEPLLTTPPVGPEPRPSRWLVGALAAAIVLLLVILAGVGSDRDGEEPAPGSRPANPEPNGAAKGDRSGPIKAPMTLLPLTAARVCVTDQGKALIDRQILATGNRERFAAAKRFVVDLEFGEIRIATGAERTRLRADTAGSPLTVVVEPGQIRRVNYSGDSCP